MVFLVTLWKCFSSLFLPFLQRVFGKLVLCVPLDIRGRNSLYCKWHKTFGHFLETINKHLHPPKDAAPEFRHSFSVLEYKQLLYVFIISIYHSKWYRTDHRSLHKVMNTPWSGVAGLSICSIYSLILWIYIIFLLQVTSNCVIILYLSFFSPDHFLGVFCCLPLVKE